MKYWHFILVYTFDWHFISSTALDIALANTLPHFALEQTTQLLYLHSFDVLRAHLDNVHDGDNGTVTLLRMLVTPVHGARGDEATFNLLKQELKRSKWLTPSTMELVYEKQPWLGVRRGEIITAMCTIMHPIMSKQNAIAFSKGNILETDHVLCLAFVAVN